MDAHMTKRRNFPDSVKIACVYRATRKNGCVYCEACGNPCKRFEIHHILSDREGGKPILSNAILLCEPCHDVESARQAPIWAKLRGQEAKHLGLRKRPQGAHLQSRGFEQFEKERRGVDKSSLPPLPRINPMTRKPI